MMNIFYEKPQEIHCELDIEKLVETIVKDYGELDFGIMDYWGDNMDSFLAQINFEDFCYLDNDTTDMIYDTVCDKLEMLLEDNE